MGHEVQVPPVACPLPALQGGWVGETEARVSALGSHLLQGLCMTASLPLLTGSASHGQFVVSGQKCKFQE